MLLIEAGIECGMRELGATACAWPIASLHEWFE